MQSSNSAILVNHSPAEPIAKLVFAHGAGAPMDTPFMNHLAEGLAAAGIMVLRFEFPYMAQRRKDGKNRPPNVKKVLVEHFLATVDASTCQLPLFLAGKSMGGRIATLISDQAEVSGIMCFGYPFHPPGKPTNLRTEHLFELATPCLILQGERDPFGNTAEVASYSLPQTISVKWLPDGDHDFKPRKKSGITWEENLQSAVSKSHSFILAHLPR